MVNHDVLQYATIFKIVRIIFLVFVILAFAKLKKDEENHDATLHHESHKVKLKIPWYVKGFFLMCFLLVLV